MMTPIYTLTINVPPCPMAMDLLRFGLTSEPLGILESIALTRALSTLHPEAIVTARAPEFLIIVTRYTMIMSRMNDIKGLPFQMPLALVYNALPEKSY